MVLGGGVLAARHPLLDDRIRELLAERAPKAVPRVVTARPVLGAALLGLDRTGAPRRRRYARRARASTTGPRGRPRSVPRPRRHGNRRCTTCANRAGGSHEA